MLESGALGFALLGVTALLVVAIIWLARRHGWERREVKTVKDTLAAIRKAEEIENEVQALDRDTLKSRAKLWLRTPRK